MRNLFARLSNTRISITTKLMGSFVWVILIISLVFTAVGIHLISSRIVAEAQEKVRYDLNAAREIYLNKLRHVYDVVRFSSDRYLLINGLLIDDLRLATDQLIRVKEQEGLDILSVTDRTGTVVLRLSNMGHVGDNQADDRLVRAVLDYQLPVSASVIISAEDLMNESPLLAEQAFMKFIDTPMARPRPETEITSGMALKAAAPVFDERHNLIGVVYGAILLNRNYEIVDKIKQTVYQEVAYKGKDIGTATIFQEDVRISTNVYNKDGSRAIATRLAENVYNRVVLEGELWTGRAYVVNDWYITAYEPIRDIDGQIIGVLYVGLLEQKYTDLERQTILVFLAIALAGVVASLVLSYLMAYRISAPIKSLALAAKAISEGKLETTVDIRSPDELGDLANAFNAMAVALKERDQALKEYTRTKIMESERLALIGQLAANVAHELNNPLQGIVTYSHLLLEKASCEDSTAKSLQKIATQANRCRDIIRALLDFSRQRKPDKTLCDITSVLQDSLSLVENQAIFHNIEVIQNYATDLPKIVIDPSQIERVFVNMIVNAADAMPNGGQLILSTRYNSQNQTVEVEFRDTGCGITKENLDKIFDPFFTTKETGHGVGLGLAISYGIVKEHRGVILVESEVGKGTTFVVRLPVAAKDVVEPHG